MDTVIQTLGAWASGVVVMVVAGLVIAIVVNVVVWAVEHLVNWLDSISDYDITVKIFGVIGCLLLGFMAFFMLGVVPYQLGMSFLPK